MATYSYRSSSAAASFTVSTLKHSSFVVFVAESS